MWPRPLVSGSRKQLQNGQHISVETVLFPGCFQARLVGWLVDGSASAVEFGQPMKLSLLEVLSGRFLKIPKVENCRLKLWICCFYFVWWFRVWKCIGVKGFWVMSGSCEFFVFVQSKWLGRKCLSGLLNISVLFGIGYQHIYSDLFGQEWS